MIPSERRTSRLTTDAVPLCQPEQTAASETWQFCNNFLSPRWIGFATSLSSCRAEKSGSLIRRLPHLVCARHLPLAARRLSEHAHRNTAGALNVALRNREQSPNAVPQAASSIPVARCYAAVASRFLHALRPRSAYPLCRFLAASLAPVAFSYQPGQVNLTKS